MKGTSSSGKKCYTNGGIINRDKDPDRQFDRSKWTAECGDQFPESIPSNVIIYNNIEGPNNFVATREGTFGSQVVTDLYLLDSARNLATNASEVARLAYFTDLQSPIVVSSDPERVGIFEFTYDRSRGAEFAIDPAIGVNSVPKIDHGSFGISVDYRETSVE